MTGLIDANDGSVDLSLLDITPFDPNLPSRNRVRCNRRRLRLIRQLRRLNSSDRLLDNRRRLNNDRLLDDNRL